MNSPHKQHICEIYKELLACVEKFEVKVKNNFNEQKQSAIVSDNNNDNAEINDDVEDNLKQIIHHLKEIKIHLDKIKQHDEKISRILEDKGNNEETKKAVVKRHVSLKKEVRQPQMKYLVQWEKYLDELRLTDANNNSDSAAVEEEEILPKPMIKKRIKQFEGTNKRMSSTYENVLDVRMSCMMENIEEFEDASVCEVEKSASLPNLCEQNEDAEQSSKIFEELYNYKEDVVVNEKNTTSSKNFEDEECARNKNESIECAGSEIEDDKNIAISQEKQNEPTQDDNLNDINTKPKIVEVIYKKKLTNR